MDRSATAPGGSPTVWRDEALPESEKSLLVDVAAELARLDLDQFERYAVATRWLAALLSTVRTRPLRLLEVGPNVLNLLPEFLDAASIEVVRCDIFLPSDNEPGFVRIYPNEPLPFEDGEFDGVLALEVLEHVPAAERSLFLTECLRVTRHACVLTCPNGGPPVNTAETIASSSYERRQGHAHPFLEEHARFGQPVATDVRDLARPFAREWHDFTISPLNHWLTNLLLQENLVERGVPLELRTLVQQFVLHRVGPAANLDYRRVYVAAQSVEASELLNRNRERLSQRPTLLVGDEATPEAVLVATALLTGPELQRFLDTLDRSGRELLASLSAAITAGTTCPEIASLQGALGEAADALRELSMRVRVEVAAGRLVGRPDTDRPFLKRQRARLGAGLRRSKRSLLRGAKRLLRQCVATTVRGTGLVPLAGMSTVDPQRKVWTAESDDAGWYIPVAFAPGPIRIRCELRTTRSGWLRLRADSLGLFERGPVFDLGETTRRLVIDRFLTLPEHASGLRLELTGVTGAVEITQLEIRQHPQWATVAIAAARKVVTAARRGTLVHMARQAAGCILRGDLAGLKAKLATGLVPPPPAAHEPAPTPESLYERYRRHVRLAESDRARLQAEAARWDETRGLSFLLPIPPEETPARIDATIESLRAQLAPNWELLLLPVGESSQALASHLRQTAQRDRRIRALSPVSRDTTAAALNRGLEAAAMSYVAVIHCGDLLADTAVIAAGQQLGAGSEFDYVYSDEDRLDERGLRIDPFFKPDFSLEYLRTLPYTQNLGVYRRDTLLKLNGFRVEYDGVHEYDAVLRLAAESARIGHLAEVLYHRATPWPFGDKPLDLLRKRELACRAVREHLTVAGTQALVTPDSRSGGQQVRFAIAGRPKVSIVIPSACGRATIRGEETWFVLKCVESILTRSTWRNYEILVVDNNDMPPELEQILSQYPQVKRVPFTQPFNLATKMTFGARVGTGEHFVFMNDDIEVISPDWIEALLEYSQQPGVGIVGARLLFPDERLQHTGVTILAGNPGHHFYRFPKEHPGYFYNNIVPRNYTAVTGACAMVPANVFWQVGGFSDEFPLNYNDVDLCLKIRAAGLRVVYTPFSELYHHESVTKSGTYEHELVRFKTKWAEALRSDPFYNPNLAMDHNDYSLRRCPAA